MRVNKRKFGLRFKFLKIGKLNIGIGVSLAAPKTVWFDRSRKGSRNDHLFGLIRSYHYKTRRYIYSFHFWRFAFRAAVERTK